MLASACLFLLRRVFEASYFKVFCRDLTYEHTSDISVWDIFNTWDLNIHSGAHIFCLQRTLSTWAHLPRNTRTVYLLWQLLMLPRFGEHVTHSVCMGHCCLAWIENAPQNSGSPTPPKITWKWVLSAETLHNNFCLHRTFSPSHIRGVSVGRIPPPKKKTSVRGIEE